MGLVCQQQHQIFCKVRKHWGVQGRQQYVHFPKQENNYLPGALNILVKTHWAHDFAIISSKA